MMTSDQLISAHKACVQRLEEIETFQSDPSYADAATALALECTRTSLTIHRDILADAIRAFLR